MQAQRRMPVRRLSPGRFLRSANVRLSAGLRSRPRLLALPLSAGFLFGLSACPDSGTVVAGGGDEDLPGVNCAIDDSTSPATAFDGVIGMDMTENFCPRRDEDYWRVNVGAPGKILQTVVTYVKLTNIRLAIDVLGPRGMCTTTGTSCTTSAQCTMPEICDPVRGACRSGIERCAAGTGCGVGTTCTSGQEAFGCVFEEPLNAASHRVEANYPAHEAGDYIVKVWDQSEQEADDQTEYTLQVSMIDDPDTHEPNDTSNQATAVTSGMTEQGYLAYARDADWYTITPGFPSPAVVEVTLTWPDGMTVDPTWTIHQDGMTFPSVDIDTSMTTNVRTQTMVLPTNGTIEVEVAPQTRLTVNCGTVEGAMGLEGYDESTPYDITITVIEDIDEGLNRNDTPDGATVMDLGTPSVMSPPQLVHMETLIAQNDRDWFRIDKSAAFMDNSLINVLTTAAAGADFVLRWTLYRDCNPAQTNIQAPDYCPPGTPCLMGGQCIRAMVQRPSPDGPGDPQIGGLARNNVQGQFPVYNNGPGALYLLVEHVASTPLPVPGFSTSQNYTLTLTHEVEQDARDAGPNPDNCFVSRPLQQAQLNRSDFCPSPRTLNSLGGAQWMNMGPAPSQGFVDVLPGTTFTAGMCAPITFEGFDGLGQPEASVGFDVTASAGQLVDACMMGMPLMNPLTTGAPAFYIPPMTAGPVTFQTTRTGGGMATLTATVPVVAAMAMPPPTYLSITDAGGAPITRAFISGAQLGPLEVNLAAAATAPVVVELSASGTAGILCPANMSGNCPNDMLMGVTLSPACGDTPQGTCQVAIDATESDYTFLVTDNTDGAVSITATEVTAMATHEPTSVFVTSHQGASFNFNMGFWGRGRISYDGDQDFFTIPIDMIPFPTHVGMTVFVRHPADDVDIRVTVERGGGGGSVGFFRNSSGGNADDCTMTGCMCDASGRNTCTRAAYNDARGPLAPMANASDDCLYLRDSGPLEVWVNDLDANDWTDNEYEFQITLQQGCPGICDPFICAN